MDITSRFVRRLPRGRIYRDRLEEELRLIQQRGFTPVFEHVLDILDLTHDIPHIVRGSAANSLLCYLTGITEFNPIVENLPLARFMHGLREDLPDIDIDFPWDRHHEVFRRLYERYGERACRISNHVHYTYSGAVREVVRRHGYRRFLPYNFQLSSIFPGQEEELEREALALVGTEKHLSLHCGGVVIFAKPPPSDIVHKPNQLTLDKDETEAAGHLKIDLLSNRALAQLVEIDPRRTIMDYPEEDSATTDLLCRGDVLGVGLAESPTFRKALVGLQPRNRHDVVLAMALIRPAAASRGRKAEFLEARLRNPDDGSTPTQDYIVYEDDVIYLIQHLIGCSQGQADLYRRAIVKGRGEEFFALIAGHPNARRIMEDLSMQRSYSFCKSHALSYGYLAWALAWQKAHQPRRFWLAALNNLCPMYRRWVHYHEAKMSGGWNLTIGRRPWRADGDTLVSPGTQLRMFEDGWSQYAKYGWWTSRRFMPGCYLRRSGDLVEVRGLIATGRHYQDLTFLTLGYASRRYLDVTIHGLLDFGDQDYLEAKGRLVHTFGSESLDVTEYRTGTLQ
jgi:DNA polymerase III alpha subunit